MRNANRLIMLLALARFALPYILQNPIYEPHRDEFLYLAEGRHLAWGFLEVPPLLSFFAWLTDLFGHSIFWIKFWPNLFGSLTFILCAKMAIRAGGSKIAVWTIFFVFVFSAWLRMFFLFQPNAPEIFFCAWMAYAIFNYIQTPHDKYFYQFGIAAGLGMLSKYTVVFWAAGLLAGLIGTQHRRILTRKHFYYGLAVGACLFLPNLLWQWQHNFPVFHHMKELKETQLEYIHTGDFLSGELMMYLPVFYVWVAGLYFCLVKVGGKYRVFAIAFLFVQLVMILLHGKAYYTAGSFVVLFALGACWLNQVFLKLKAIRYLAFAFTILLGLVFWPVLLPVAAPPALASFYKEMKMDNSGFLTWEDLKIHPLPQDFADMIGWEEMAGGVAHAHSLLDDSQKKNVLIWCDNYGQAGAVNYYRKKFNIPEAYSTNGSFLFWLPSTSLPENVILVSDNEFAGDDPHLKQFASVRKIDMVKNPYAREYRSAIFLLEHPSDALRGAIRSEIENKRQIFEH